MKTQIIVTEYFETQADRFLASLPKAISYKMTKKKFMKKLQKEQFILSKWKPLRNGEYYTKEGEELYPKEGQKQARILWEIRESHATKEEIKGPFWIKTEEVDFE